MTPRQQQVLDIGSDGQWHHFPIKVAEDDRIGRNNATIRVLLENDLIVVDDTSSPRAWRVVRK
jgi:hypothetical protein